MSLADTRIASGEWERRITVSGFIGEDYGRNTVEVVYWDGRFVDFSQSRCGCVAIIGVGKT